MIRETSVWATLGSQMVWHAVGAELELWLDPYLDLTWWMGHPVWSVLAVLLLLVIAQAILGLASYLIKRFLLVLLKLPYVVFQWVLRRAASRLQVPVPALFVRSSPPHPSQSVQGQIAALVQQLEATQRLQDEQLQELKRLVQLEATVGQGNGAEGAIAPVSK